LSLRINTVDELGYFVWIQRTSAIQSPVSVGSTRCAFTVLGENSASYAENPAARRASSRVERVKRSDRFGEGISRQIRDHLRIGGTTGKIPGHRMHMRPVQLLELPDTSLRIIPRSSAQNRQSSRRRPPPAHFLLKSQHCFTP